jgi:hypothetical protein
MYDDNITPGDERVSTLFHDTAADVEVDVAALVHGGITRGRTKHRLQSVGTAFAAAVGVAGIAGAALTIGPGLGSSGNGSGQGEAPVAASASAKPTPVPTASSGKPSMAGPRSNWPGGKSTNVPPPATAEIPVKAASLPGTFAQLFPGKITQAEKRTGRIIDDGRQNQIAHFLWKGYLVGVGFSAYNGTPAQRCAESSQDAKLAGRPRQTCTERPDGTFLSSEHGTEPAVDGGGKANIATLITKDGYEIWIQVYTYGAKGGHNLSTQPPLSEGQLKQAVTSKTWF